MPDGHVTVLRVELDQSDAEVARLSSLLDEQQLSRARRIVGSIDRARFVVAHARVRQVLGAALEVAPEAVRLGASARGKPHLLGPARASFNLSHSDGVALIAVAGSVEVGVDIERVRADLAWTSLARSFLAPAETAALLALAAERRCDGFFACWTRKEALVKMFGEGLHRPFADFTVSVDPDAAAAADEGCVEGDWTLRDLDAAPGFRACVAARARPLTTRTCTYASDETSASG